MCQEILSNIFFDLLLTEEKSKRHYLLIKDFNTFMYDYALYHGKHFCYCLQVFSTEEILKHHINDCFKINGEQMIQMMSKEDSNVKFKKYEKISPWFIQILEVFRSQKTMKSKIQMNLKQTNIKNMLLAFMAMN